MAGSDAPLRLSVVVGDDAAAAARIALDLPPSPGMSLVCVIADPHQLASRLHDAATMPVIVLDQSPVVLEHGRIYIAPAGRALSVTDGRLVPGAPHVASRDWVLRSAADALGARCAAVVVAGRGSDGVLGVRRVKEVGGATIAQDLVDQPTSELPRLAVASGAIDIKLPLAELASQLAMLATSDPRLDRALLDPDAGDPAALRDILTLIRVRTNHDFRPYRRGMLYRRLARRMQVRRTSTVADYQRILREDHAELAQLVRDFLTTVTSFFRDPDMFRALEEQVIPHLFSNRSSEDQLRVWVAGCATGEEAYSLGMLMCEHASRLDRPPRIQIFATDLDETAIAAARAGVYPEAIALDVPASRLDRFFTLESGSYRIANELREITLFSSHDLLRDPPFSRIDLLACRNVLLYLDAEAQQHVLGAFHFALRPRGFLFLGHDAVDTNRHFVPFDAEHRIFERRIAPAWARPTPPERAQGARRPRMPLADVTARDLHARAIEQHAPPSVLVDAELEVIAASDDVGRFVRRPGAQGTRALVQLAHPDLADELREAVVAARVQPERRFVRLEDEHASRLVQLRAQAVEVPGAPPGTVLVLFEELAHEPARPSSSTRRPSRAGGGALEQELSRAREQLDGMVAQYEAAVFELQTTSDELFALNEELRLITEELELNKAELESTNRELRTLSEELKATLAEAGRANSDLQNLMAATDVAALFVDRDLNIKRFTPRAQDLFAVVPSDVGRPIMHLTHRLDATELTADAEQVLVDLRTLEREIRSKNGRRYLVRLMPYRSLDDRIEGVVIAFFDVTALRLAEEARRRSEAALHATEDRLALALQSVAR